MKIQFYLLFVLLISFFFPATAQDVLEWSDNYALQFSDFQSPSTSISMDNNRYSLYNGCSIDFAFQMTNAEFMFTKNFNSKVNNSFVRNVAAIIAPDSTYAMNLLLFARYEFDLAELYVRKIRQQLYETKGAFSSPTFFQPIFDRIKKEYNERHAAASQRCDLGSNRVVLKELHDEVRTEINTNYPDFCKTCKPVKKKK